MAGAYIAGQFPWQELFYEARVQYGTSDNNVTPIGTYADGFDTTRFLTSAMVEGTLVMGTTTINPAVSVRWYEETQESYVDSLNNPIPENTVPLGEVRFGPSFSRSFTQKNGTVVQPEFGISGVYNFAVDSKNAPIGSLLGDERLRARVDAGIAVSNTHRLGPNVSGYYDRIGADDHEAYGGNARLTIPLN